MIQKFILIMTMISVSGLYSAEPEDLNAITFFFCNKSKWLDNMQEKNGEAVAELFIKHYDGLEKNEKEVLSGFAERFAKKVEENKDIESVDDVFGPIKNLNGKEPSKFQQACIDLLYLYTTFFDPTSMQPIDIENNEIMKFTEKIMAFGKQSL